MGGCKMPKLSNSKVTKEIFADSGNSDAPWLQPQEPVWGSWLTHHSLVCFTNVEVLIFRCTKNRCRNFVL